MGHRVLISASRAMVACCGSPSVASRWQAWHLFAWILTSISR